MISRWRSSVVAISRGPPVLRLAQSRYSESLAREFAQSRPAISRHLRVLRETLVVTEQRVGRERIYRLHAARLQDVAGWIDGKRGVWEQQPESLKLHLDEGP